MPNRPNFPVPDDIYADTICIQLNVPNTPQWKQVLGGCLMEMGYWFNWQRTGDDSGSQAAKRWRSLIDEIDWSGMGCCCPEPPPIQYRWSGLTLEVSTDGGVTFNTSTAYDYRQNSARWPKPSEVGLTSTKCQGADSVVAFFRDQINQQIVEDMTAASILGVIAAALAILLSEGTAIAIAAQVQGVVAAILATGVTAFQAAFTTEVYDKLRCLIYCNMDSDESITQAGIDAVYAALDTELTGIVVPTLKGYIAAAGLVGINNMIAGNGGDPDADCSECECVDSCNVENWHTIDGHPEYGVFVDYGEDYIEVNCTTVNTDGRYYLIIKTGSSSQCCQPSEGELVSGAFNLYNAGRNYCGEDPIPTGGIGVPNHIGAPDTFGCSTYLQYVSTTPFVWKLHFDVCPP